jgi:hypothetical protein
MVKEGDAVSSMRAPSQGLALGFFDALLAYAAKDYTHGFHLALQTRGSDRAVLGAYVDHGPDWVQLTDVHIGKARVIPAGQHLFYNLAHIVAAEVID